MIRAWGDGGAIALWQRMPFYRLEQWQRSLGVPLAASTQWELADAVARVAQPAGDHLAWVAAQAPNLFNDDTVMRVPICAGKSGRGEAGAPGHLHHRHHCQRPDHPIALFFTGRRHAGENLDQFCGSAPRTCPRRCRCAMASRATSLPRSKPSWLLPGA